MQKCRRFSTFFGPFRRQKVSNSTLGQSGPARCVWDSIFFRFRQEDFSDLCRKRVGSFVILSENPISRVVKGESNAYLSAVPT
jgi:hypothetical protein